jgi:hypothetical protein
MEFGFLGKVNILVTVTYYILRCYISRDLLFSFPSAKDVGRKTVGAKSVDFRLANVDRR